MKPDPSKLRQQHQEEQQAAALHQSQQKPQGLEFDSVEEIIRYDAGQTPVPPGIAERLNESITREPKPQRSWWRRLFGGD